MLMEQHVDPRLHVDLIGAERSLVDRPARIADHFGANAVHGG